MNGHPRGIVHGRSATQLTYDFSRHLSKAWGEDDEIVVTRLDHDSNVRPWVQAAERVGATVRWVDFDPETGELSTEPVEAALTDRTRLVAVTGGVEPHRHDARRSPRSQPPPTRPVRCVYVDGVHYTAHELPDVDALGADFFTCSPYKFLGPHCGVLAARPELLETIAPDKLLPATNAVPERFEFGTLPYELLAGVTAAVDVLAGLATSGDSGESDVAELAPREARRFVRRTARARGGAARADRGRPRRTARRNLWSRAARRTPTLLATFEGHEASDLTKRSPRARCSRRSGNFYALEASRHLGLGDAGGLRVGLAPYTDADDVERLLDGLAAALADGGADASRHRGRWLRRRGAPVRRLTG